MNTKWIQGGTVYDGLGGPPVVADLLIKGDRIYKIGNLTRKEKEEAGNIISARGKIVCPGFIDIHRHCDAKPFNDEDFGRRELAQGITTVVVGNCGISLTPAPEALEKRRELYAFQEAVLGVLDESMPISYEDYLKRLQASPLPVNMATMIGTGSVRIKVKGFADGAMIAKEREAARELIEDAMERGAVGISLGIMYLPECYSSIEDFAYILEPVGRYGRMITTHIRGEGDSLVQSVEEVVEIARRVGCALQISHFKSCGPHNWQRLIREAAAVIEKAREEGIDAACDFYPYEGGSTALTTMLPPSFVRGDMKAALERLGTEEGLREFRKLGGRLYEDWDNFCVILGWERIIISGVTRKEYEKMLGLRVTEAAEVFGYEDAWDLAAELMHREEGRTAIINMSMCQEDIDFVAKLPYSIVISDAIYAQTDTPHPRMYGAFPKIIREYVKERGIYSLEEAIYRMCGLAAKRIGLQDRGVIKEGAFADILIFDPKHFRDNATFASPAGLATGLDYALVNGQKVIEKDDWTEKRRCGRVILAEKGREDDK